MLLSAVLIPPVISTALEDCAGLSVTSFDTDLIEVFNLLLIEL
jgi:hypothetical protein